MFLVLVFSRQLEIAINSIFYNVLKYEMSQVGELCLTVKGFGGELRLLSPPRQVT